MVLGCVNAFLGSLEGGQRGFGIVHREWIAEIKYG